MKTITAAEAKASGNFPAYLETERGRRCISFITPGWSAIEIENHGRFAGFCRSWPVTPETLLEVR